ncbi:CHRD domain-containing protein [Hymenobacter sp. BT730]|uniref:CHRD domain-containing protein n=1 Tax=Hymenobacter sp. BT730 TaxID=3063332 RepID=UPI0026DF5802|nr:CHRD domain-containing protein [Hymenobacter sp. BT730]
MRTSLYAFGLLLALAAAPACDDDEDDTLANNTVQLQATLNGAQEVPATTSTATGSFTGTYNTNTRLISYTVTYQGLTPTAGHIHQAAPGVNGPIIVPFANVSTSPITGSETLSEENGAKLLAGETYTNLHTTALPGGEIRGNITVQ